MPPKPTDKASPVIAQYLELKAINPGYLLMYQLGDFYELFFDDAVEASEKLGLTLTKRGTYQGKDIPMAGVPLKVADEYLQKAIKVGFRVAVVEQLENPAEAKKRGPKAVVRRDVTRLVTPGTLTEDNLLDAGANNFLTTFFQHPSDNNTPGQPQHHRYSIASIDISTGEFLVSEVTDADMQGELARLAPSEIIHSDAISGEPHIRALFRSIESATTPVPHLYYSSLSGEAALKAALKVEDLGGFGNFSRGELAAIGALLKYIDLTQIGKAPLIRPPKRSATSKYMVIDSATRTNLELLQSTRMTKKGSLFDAIDRTVTGPGARQLSAAISAPLMDVSLINQRLNAIEFFINNSADRDALRKLIRRTPDLARSLSRLSLGRASPRDLGSIRAGLEVAHSILEKLTAYNDQHLPAHIRDLKNHLNKSDTPLANELQNALSDELPNSVKDGSFIRKGYHVPLDEQRSLRDESRSILAKLQAEYREQTGVKSLKIRHNNQFGFFVEVTALHAATLLAEPHSESFRHRQTLANNTRFTTDELVETEASITMAAERALAIETGLYEDLREKVNNSAYTITQIAEALADLDMLLALALLSEEENYSRPIVDESLAFTIKNGRHPVVEQALRSAKSGPFIENSCTLAKGPGKGNNQDAACIWLLTGPNMAGKSTFLRQNALIAIMAQMGCYVPAASAHIGLVDRLFSRVGASDDLARGRSTFMVEMVETAAILNQATGRSLVILDEIGRGTATFDGLSIAWASVEYLHDKTKARALFATHYHELTTIAEKRPLITNATIEVKEWNDEIVFLHRVIMGAADRSYGIQVAKLAGLPAPVIHRANEVLTVLEAENEKSGAINQLEDLPLFSLDPPAIMNDTAPTTSNPQAEKLHEQLAAINPDDITPKAALEMLYKLKALSEEEN